MNMTKGHMDLKEHDGDLTNYRDYILKLFNIMFNFVLLFGTAEKCLFKFNF